MCANKAANHSLWLYAIKNDMISILCPMILCNLYKTFTLDNEATRNGQYGRHHIN